MDNIKKFADKVKKEWDARTPQERAGLIVGSVVGLVAVVVVGTKVAKKDKKQDEAPVVATAKGGNLLKEIIDKVTGSAK